MFLSRVTGSVSNGNLSPFDVISSKASKIVGDEWLLLPLGTGKVACSVNDVMTVIFRPKLPHQSFVAPYSTDNLTVSKLSADAQNNCYSAPFTNKVNVLLIPH